MGWMGCWLNGLDIGLGGDGLGGDGLGGDGLGGAIRKPAIAGLKGPALRRLHHCLFKKLISSRKN
jgi:hypothetical protein